MGPSRCRFGVQILLLQRGPGGPGWEMGEPASKGLVGVLGGWRWADAPVNTALGWSERPMPPVPTCDIPFDHQLTMHATWPAESRTLSSRAGNKGGTCRPRCGEPTEGPKNLEQSTRDSFQDCRRPRAASPGFAADLLSGWKDGLCPSNAGVAPHPQPARVPGSGQRRTGQ